MFKLDVEALLLGNARHMHQTRAVRPCDVFSTCLHVALYLVTTHLGTDSGLFNGEHAAKTAAFVRTLRLYDIDAIDELKQVFDLVELLNMLLGRRGEPKLTDTVAGVVEACSPLKRKPTWRSSPGSGTS